VFISAANSSGDFVFRADRDPTLSAPNPNSLAPLEKSSLNK